MASVGVRRRGCCCGGVFPEESSASWGAYGRALMEMGPGSRTSSRRGPPSMSRCTPCAAAAAPTCAASSTGGTSRGSASAPSLGPASSCSPARRPRRLPAPPSWFFCVLAITLCLMQPYRDIDPDVPFSVAFTAVGMDWAKYIVAFGALKGMTTVLLVRAVGQARYLTHIARTHMAPPCLAVVSPHWGTPVPATVTMLAATAIIAFFIDLGDVSWWRLARLTSGWWLRSYGSVALSVGRQINNWKGAEEAEVEALKFGLQLQCPRS